MVIACSMQRLARTASRRPRSADPMWSCLTSGCPISKARKCSSGYSLLRFLVTHAGKGLTHRQLLTDIWGAKAVEQTHYLRVHIAHLREKIEHDPSQPKLIITEPAIGYRLVELA